MKRRYGYTCLMLLSHAGAIDDHAGNNPHVPIVDSTDGKPRVFSSKDVLDPSKSMEETLRHGEFILALCSGAL